MNACAEDEAPPAHCSDAVVSTKNMPKNNNQNEHNWCVFWTSADLFSFYEEEPLSSYDLGLQYFNNDLVRDSEVADYTDMPANLTGALILSQKGKGVCLESQTNFTEGDWGELSVMFKKLSDPKKSLIKTICENNYLQSKPFAGIPKNILTVLDKLSADKKAAALLDVTCGKRHQFKQKYGVAKRGLDNFPPEKLIEKLDQLLDKNNPASISYDWDFIKNGPTYTKVESNHSSTIIGRRINPATQKCEYQIKDSAGNRCPRNVKYECIKENGTIWVPRSDLQNNVFELNWLVKPN
jgi:hypothetical protein